MHNLINAAPSFDGTEDIDFWLEEVTQYLDRCEVYDEKIVRNVFIGALTGSAREWFGSLSPEECNKLSVTSIKMALEERYGKTHMQKIRKFETLKQKPSETLAQYADRLRKAAYGTRKSTEEIIYKFYTTISNSSAVYDYVINLPCASLAKAVEYVEQHSRGSEDRPRKPPCSLCKRYGHNAKTCRYKKKKDQKSKKVDHIEADEEADDDNSCNEAEEEEEEQLEVPEI